MRRSVVGRGLDGFVLELGRATMSGDVVPVVLRHSVSLLGAGFARLVLGSGGGTRCWSIDDGHVSTTPVGDGDDPFWWAEVRLDGRARTRRLEVAGRPAQAMVVGHRSDEGVLVLGVGRSGRRAFDDRDRTVLESLFALADVALQNMQLLSRLRDKADALEHLATHDPLTGLGNRRWFRERAEQALASGRSGAVLLIDLDRFKEVNDTLGHQVGDELLVEVAGRLRSAVGVDGLIARLGGDEFAVLLHGSAASTRARATRIHQQLEGPVDLGDVRVDVGASIGVAELTGSEQSLGPVLRHADVAMYSAKAGRTAVESYSADLDHHRPESLALVARFRSAVERGELHLAFQPQFDTRTDAVVGAEALARWSVPGVGPVAPAEFIPIAESTGLIRPMTDQVLATALRECRRWSRPGAPVRVSVNIAPRVLLEPGFSERISDLLAEAALPAELLRLEVTETTVMSDPALTVGVLRDLTDRGVSIAIDDFGTGHSSLSYLTSLPCHELKIDRSFVMALESGDRRARAVVTAIINLGRDLGMDVIAEGVETERAAEQLQRLGCRVVQGFLYSRPVRASELTRVLHRTSAGHGGDPQPPPFTGVVTSPGRPSGSGRPPAGGH